MSARKKGRARARETRDGRGSACPKGPRKSSPSSYPITCQCCAICQIFWQKTDPFARWNANLWEILQNVGRFGGELQAKSNRGPEQKEGNPTISCRVCQKKLRMWWLRPDNPIGLISEIWSWITLVSGVITWIAAKPSPPCRPPFACAGSTNNWKIKSSYQILLAKEQQHPFFWTDGVMHYLAVALKWSEIPYFFSAANTSRFV